MFSVSSFKKERAQLICEEKGHPFFFFNKLTRETEVAMIKVLSPFKDNSFIALVNLLVNKKFGYPPQFRGYLVATCGYL